MPGRPKHFDESTALEQAMELFWVKGYDCTGISDLEKTLGIGRQSIYNTFGDKRSLFLKAFQHYTHIKSKAMIGLIREPGSPREKIDHFLTTLINTQCTKNPDNQRAGCLLTNSVSSSIQSDPEAAAVVLNSLKRLHKELSSCLAEVITDTTELKKTAWLLVNTAQGFCVLSKSGQPKNTLIGIKNKTLSLIFNSQFSNV